MKDFYFTFGYGQVPGIGWYAIVKANDMAEAAEKMVTRLGNNRWALSYRSAEDAGVERFNLKLWEVIT